MKPKILLIADKPNWAFDFKANSLMEHLSSKYDFTKVYSSLVSEQDVEGWAGFDVIYSFHYRSSIIRFFPNTRQIKKDRVIAGITDYTLCRDINKYRMAALLLRYKAIIVVSPMLYEAFKDKHDHVFYAPWGVNTKLFFPPDKKTYSKELRVGWAGSLTNHPGKRGYHDFIVPAIEKMKGVVLKTAAREEKWRTQQEMVEFYHSLDAYICASWTEGTPCTALEAASCGLPVVTTRVGNMPELIKDGYNGLFIERDIDSIISALTKLRDDRELAVKMGERNRKEILKNWSWEKQVKSYDKVFEFMLEGGG